MSAYLESLQSRAASLQPGATRSRLRHISDILADIKPLQWAVRGVAPDGALIEFFGDPETWKSLAALDIGLCVAAGRDWRGARVKQGAVVYVCGEGLHGVKLRVLAWCRDAGVDPADVPLYVVDAPVPLIETAAAEALQRDIEALGVDVRLMIVDTLSRNFGPGDENSTGDMVRFIGNVDAYLRIPFGAAVIVVHHSGVADKNRSRGNSSLRGAIDSQFAFVKAGDTVTMSCRKMKDGAYPEDRHFCLTVREFPDVRDEDGNRATAPLLVAATAPKQPDWQPTGAAAEMLAILRKPAGYRAGYRMGVRAWKEACTNSGVNPNTYKSACATLKNAGVIVIEDGEVFEPEQGDWVKLGETGEFHPVHPSGEAEKQGDQGECVLRHSPSHPFCSPSEQEPYGSVDDVGIEEGFL